MRINIRCRSGFTLVEIMIVVAIIGLLAAVAIPNLVKARTTAQTKACLKNLQQIDGSKEQWAIENKKSEGSATAGSESEISAYLKGGLPQCPAGGTYSYEVLGTNPKCTIVDHAL